MKQFTTTLFLSLLFFTAQAQCSAGTQTALQTCFTSGSTPITLTANITLSTTLTIPGSPNFVLYVGTFDITGSTWTTSGNPQMTASVNASSPTIVFTKNGTNKFTDINSLGSIRTAMSTVLSVELLDFKGTHTEGGNQLTWTTAHEVNNKGFSVEKQTSNAWETLGFVAAQSKGTYQFTDNVLLGISYYRLRQEDVDGTETLSKTLSVQANKFSKVKVTPSVTSGILTIESANNIELVNIFSSIGQLVYTSAPITNNQYTINHLPSGVYIVRVASGSEVTSEKIFKQ